MSSTGLPPYDDQNVFARILRGEIPCKKIYENVSQQAWQQWTEFCKMLLNEYRLNPARREDQEVIVKQMQEYFFGQGATAPVQYVPPPQK